MLAWNKFSKLTVVQQVLGLELAMLGLIVAVWALTIPSILLSLLIPMQMVRVIDHRPNQRAANGVTGYTKSASAYNDTMIVNDTNMVLSTAAKSRRAVAAASATALTTATSAGH